MNERGSGIMWKKFLPTTPALCLAAALFASDSLSAEPTPDALLAALPPQSQANEAIVFDVLMDGSKIGRHAVTLWHKDDKTYVDIDIALKVGLGPIVFYRYEQQNRALWERGFLTSFLSETNDDGDEFIVAARRNTDGVAVAINGTEEVVVSDWFPTTYWDKRTVFQNRLLATRDGEVLDVETRSAGIETIEVKGRAMRAEKFEMRGDLDIDLWYDESDRWVKLAFTYRGNRFDYVLQ